MRKTYWIHALTPLHVGAGRGVGYIDMPIMRERVTGWPMIPGSAIKGVIRDDVETNGTDEKKLLLNQAFGRSDKTGESANSGSLVFTDARLICLPVRSLYGTFSWVTSGLALRRFARDSDDLSPIPEAEEDAVLLPTTENEIGSVVCDGQNKVYFEDLDFNASPSPDVLTWAKKLSEKVFPNDPGWGSEFQKRFAVVSNASFDFLCEHATEISAHIRIAKDTKTVESGALWYEEALPAETLLSGLVWCDRVFGGNGVQDKTQQEIEKKKLIDNFCKDELTLQIGGKATVGRGRVRCLFSAEAQ